MIAISSIDTPRVADLAILGPLVESIKRHGVLQPMLVQERSGTYGIIAGHNRLGAAIAAGLKEVPCLVHHVSDDEAARLAQAVSLRTASPIGSSSTTDVADQAMHTDAAMARSLATLTACADLLSGAESELSRAVVGNLIRAEAWRASCLLQATRVVRQELPCAKSAVSPVGVVDQVLQRFSPEHRLRSVEFTGKRDIAREQFIVGDERLLVGAVSSAVIATLPLLEGVAAASLTVSVAAEGPNHVMFAVSQNSVAVPETWSARAFDAQWPQRPGSMSVLVAMSAIRHTADAHGGRATVTATPRGTRIAIVVPLGS
jgi:ParB/RepB/Spo0J family partition protein